MKSLLAAVLLLAGLAHASTGPVARNAAADRLFSQPLPPTLDGRLSLDYFTVFGTASSPPRHNLLVGDSADAAGARVSLIFKARPSAAQALELEARGCRFERLPSGALANVGPVVDARCTWEALEHLAHRADVARVEPSFGQRPLPPLPPPATTTARQVEVVQLRGKLKPKGRGEGVVVGDMDSGFDPFHPQMFRADGGAYRWIDVDGDGLFTPGVDAVDFNRNGVADPGETLRVIKAMVLWDYGVPHSWNSSGPFVPDVDWLYQDENGDGTRNQGPVRPYGDEKPTYGEQLYVADDVNHNGLLDRDEKVIRLNTPKVKAARSSSGRVYRRGVDLAQFQQTAGDEMHGTMVLGTIAGGDPRYLRYAGMAPDVDLVLSSTRGALVADLAWAESEGATVMLWEMATWYFEYLDGSSALETACDAASDQGDIQLAAAGNLGGSQKHRMKQHATGTEAVPLVVPAGSTTDIYGNFNWHGAVGDLAVTLQIGTDTVPLTTAGGQLTTAAGVTVQWGTATSSRGTAMLNWYFGAPTGQAFPAQTITFSVVNSGAPLMVHGWVTDNWSGWGLGVNWPTTTGATDVGTYGTPAVGDKTLAVATQYSDFVPSGETAGHLAYYSGQGPRSDGQDTVDLTAPEDHITGYSTYGQVPFGAMGVGGGTSNATPLVVGLTAVLKGLRPTATPAELRDLLKNNAQVDSYMGSVPNDSWGAGKVRVWRAQFGQLPTASNAPGAAGSAVDTAGTLALDASASSDPEGEALTYFWDLDYDGIDDLGPLTTAATSDAFAVPDLSYARLEVVDPHGESSTALVPVEETLGLGGGGLTPRVKTCGCTAGGATPALLLAALLLRRRRARGGRSA